MDIFLLRHAIAAEKPAQGSADADRELTDEGRTKLKKTIRAMQALDLDFDWILTSSYARARQTAEAVLDSFPKAKFRALKSLEPGGDFAKVIAHIMALAPSPKSVLLVGHEPDLSELTSMLVGAPSPLCFEFKKAGLCKLTLRSFHPRPRAELVWLL